MERRLRKYLAAAAIGTIAWGAILYLYFYVQVEQSLELKEAELNTAYDSVLSGYQEFSEVTWAWLLQDPDTRKLLRKLSETGSAQARGLLYRKWHPLFKALRAKKVRKMHFIDAQGNSQLRMHEPTMVGDSLLSVRPLVREALSSGRYVTGFENSRLSSGFRFIYPVHDQGDLLGAFEISLSFNAIRKLLAMTSAPDATIQFLLNRNDLLRSMTLPDSTTEATAAYLNRLYVTSSIHPDLVTEDIDHALFGESVEPLPYYAAEVERAFAENPKQVARLFLPQSHSMLVCPAILNCYSMALLPVKTAAGKIVANIMSYAPNPVVKKELYRLLIAFLIGVLLIATAIYSIARSTRARKELATLTEHMNKGIYVINQSGNIIYANPQAGKILGYESSELLGENAHSLFHYETSTESDHAEHCPIRNVTKTGDVFRGSDEVFLHRSKALIPVEVTASPLVESGEITAVITVFDDISNRLKADEKLRQSDAAFRQSAEGIMILGPDRVIQAVNPAFTSITGYTEEEVRGKSPSILSSDRHSSGFYAEMDDTLKQHRLWQGEIYNQKKDGTIYPEWLSITTVHDHRDRLTHYVGVFHDISELKKKEERLEFVAQHDTLTNLPNRSLLRDRLEQALARSRRQQNRLAVLFADLDRFKQVNDSLGHDIGDTLLCEAARRIATCIRDYDTLARQGGDEFVILIEDVSDDCLVADIANRIVEVIRAPFELDGHDAFVGISIGVAIYPTNGHDAGTLQRLADAAMYVSKRNGGNRVTFHHAAETDAIDRMHMISSLHRALSNNEFILHFQPKFNLCNQHIQGVEALIRWQHPDQGLLYPARFLPTAIEAGLMADIGDWVAWQAVAQLAAWRAAGIDLSVCINVDGSQLIDDVFPKRIEQLLKDFEVPPEYLGIEVTETAILPESENVLPNLRRLQQRGITLSIDDFGTGHSSLTRLKQLPFRVLKIDYTFVRNMTNDPSDRTIVGATIALAHKLGLKVIAEGVETKEQVLALQSMGCDAVQGFLFAKPMLDDELVDFLNNGGEDAIRQKIMPGGCEPPLANDIDVSPTVLKATR